MSPLQVYLSVLIIFNLLHTTLALLVGSKKYKDLLWQTHAQRKSEWSKIEAVKKTGIELDAKLNPLKTGRQPVWSEEAKK